MKNFQDVMERRIPREIYFYSTESNIFHFGDAMDLLLEIDLDGKFLILGYERWFCYIPEYKDVIVNRLLEVDKFGINLRHIYNNWKLTEEQKNKITDLTVYYDYDVIINVDELIIDLKNMTSLPIISKSFFIISTNSMGYELRAANVKDLDIRIDLNYGESFVDKYDDIVDKLKNNKHGLFLFHGEPGTGKTNLIRKLISDLSEDKTIIYVPSYFMFDIANPELISFISKFKNSVLLLEDAEQILTSTEEERNQAVANILNICDGLLNDHMDMQIIATFNANKKVIDKALLRKGRLMVDIGFKKLSAIQATNLSKYIGLNKTYTEPKTLAEIYEEKVGKQLVDNDLTPTKIGFNYEK